MPTYHIRFLGADGQPRANERLICMNDEGAMQRARSISIGYHAVDVWKGARMLCTLARQPDAIALEEVALAGNSPAGARR